MPNLNYVSPLFMVASLKASLAYYTNTLGFEIRYLGPANEPYFAIVGRDNVEIMIKGDTNDTDIKPVPNHTRIWWARIDAFISTNDPDTLFEEYQRAGVRFHRPIGNDDDGLRGFEVEDVNGYILFFGRPWP